MSKYYKEVPIDQTPEKDGVYHLITTKGKAATVKFEKGIWIDFNDYGEYKFDLGNFFTHYLKPVDHLPITKEQADPSVLVEALEEIGNLIVAGKRYSLAYDNAREIALKALATHKESKPSQSISREQAEEIWTTAANSALNCKRVFGDSEWDGKQHLADREEFLKQFE